MTDLNPYRPPGTEPAEPFIEEQVDDIRWTPARKLSTALVVIGSLAYVVFIVILLNSTTNDFKAGLIWTLNVPVLLGWLVSTAMKKRSAGTFGFAAAAMQFLIALMMAMLDIGDIELVVIVNAIVAAAFALLGIIALVAWRPN